jgi:hypothetical protein
MPQVLNEDSLQAGDLRGLVSHIFEVDNYKSKMGDDKDVVVLSFTVESKNPAEDLVGFIEKGYQFVLDADMTPGELDDGKYRVFVELQRDRHVAEQICDMLYGVKKLTGIDHFKFRYHKSFNSIDAVQENLAEMIPNDPLTYDQQIQERKKTSLESFFSKTSLDKIVTEGEILKVKKTYAEALTFKIIQGGSKEKVLESIKEKINVNEWAEIIFLTKYFGDFNITKFGNKLMFEDNDQAVLLERL